MNTVKRWVGDGKLHPVWTPGGHRRFREAEVDWLYTMTPREAQQ